MDTNTIRRALVAAGLAAGVALTGFAGVANAAPAADTAAAPASLSVQAPTGVKSEPVLGGAPGNPAAQGLGAPRPTYVDLGGASATGVYQNIAWNSWGGPIASGTAVASYSAPGAPIADAKQEQAVVFASDLGVCDGKLAYRTLSAYFPQHGEKPADARAVSVCEE
ncbi:hypothetical protein [Pseudonocardia phyllosphaerae]|uniref:hypothetical protein n=1 Tax=Pseudonocardia phyllosphaerae TaxID=3390502 RepID=UPI0039780C6D